MVDDVLDVDVVEGTVASAATGFTIPKPVGEPIPVESASGVAVDSSVVATWAGVSVEFAPSTIAAAAETYGVAIDVPVM